MPDLVINCPNIAVYEGLRTALLGEHPIYGCEDRPDDLKSLVARLFDNDSQARENGMLSVEPSCEGVRIVLSHPPSDLVLVSPRLSKEEIDKLDSGIYRALIRLRGPRWNDEGVMLFCIERRTKAYRQGSRVYPVGQLISLHIWDRDWAEYREQSLNRDGMIGDDEWYMEILSVPIRVDSPPPSIGGSVYSGPKW